MSVASSKVLPQASLGFSGVRPGSIPFTPESRPFNRVTTVERESLPLECCNPVPPAAAWRTAFAHRRDVYDFALPTGVVQSGRVLCRLYLNTGTLALWHSLSLSIGLIEWLIKGGEQKE